MQLFENILVILDKLLEWYTELLKRSGSMFIYLYLYVCGVTYLPASSFFIHDLNEMKRSKSL